MAAVLQKRLVALDAETAGAPAALRRLSSQRPDQRIPFDDALHRAFDGFLVRTLRGGA
ncbi:hypothetical protein [Rhodoblastus sp.]|uniref:hypothetical protein n=1 Tax=Rhodoblastus sp. TaxID=1962975 RepID=UPI0035AE1A06